MSGFWQDGFWSPLFWASGFWGDEEQPAVSPGPTLSVGRRDMRLKRRAEAERQARRRREAEFFLIGMP
jgi:hypothetical protein